MSEFARSKPVYKQLEDDFISKIQNGTWPVHSKIKDEITLAQELGVSRGTLRKALKELVAKGMLSQIKGRGTFVVSSIIEQPLASKFISFAEAMDDKSLPYKTIVLKQEIITPDFKVAAFLELGPGDAVVSFERVRLVDNYPVIYLKNYVPLGLCPGIMDDDLVNNTLFFLIEHKYNHKIDWGRRYFKAVPAWGEIAHNLALDIGTPVMYLEQTAYTNSLSSHAALPVEYSNVWINSERFEIVSVIPR